MYTALLKSGLLKVELLDSNKYELTLAKNADDIDLVEVLKNLKKVSVFKNKNMKDILSEIPEEMDDFFIKQINKALEQFHKYNTATVVVKVESGKISSADVNWELDLKKLLEAGPGSDSDVANVKSVVFKERIKISYVDAKIAYTPKEKHTISINKIMDAAEAVSKKMYSSFESTPYHDKSIKKLEKDDWKKDKWEEDEWDDDYMDYDEEDIEEPVDIDEVLNNISEDAWYREHAENLVMQGILTSMNPEKNITGDYLYNAIYNAYGEPNEELKGSKKKLSKLTAIKEIIKAFYPEESNPIKFVIENKIIKGANIKALKNSKMIEAEFYKIFDLVLQLLE